MASDYWQTKILLVWQRRERSIKYSKSRLLAGPVTYVLLRIDCSIVRAAQPFKAGARGLKTGITLHYNSLPYERHNLAVPRLQISS